MRKSLKGAMKPFVLTAGAFVATLTIANMQPIKAQAAELDKTPEPVKKETKDSVSYKAQKAPSLETEDRTYWKDGKNHPALTEESVKDLNEWVVGLTDENGDLAFPDVSPGILEAQQDTESKFFVDATSGNNGTGSQVGLSQSSCKYNIDNVNKWVFLVGEEPVKTKEECREMLLKYPALNAVVEAEQLQQYFDRCPSKYSDNPMKYALSYYRWGGNISPEYNGENDYADSILERSRDLDASYEARREEKADTIILEAGGGKESTRKSIEAYLNRTFGKASMDRWSEKDRSIGTVYDAIQDTVDRTTRSTNLDLNGDGMEMG